MAKKSFHLCIVMHVVLSTFITSMRSHIIEQTKMFAKLDKQQKSFDRQKSNFRNVTLTDEDYIFTGKVLKSFYEQENVSSQYQKNVLPILQSIPKRSYFAAVVKVKRVFRGNRSNIGPFRKVLIISSSLSTCHKESEEKRGVNHNRCIMLFFAKPISFGVFKAEFTLLEAGINERDDNRLIDGLGYRTYSRLRKGIVFAITD